MLKHCVLHGKNIGYFDSAAGSGEELQDKQKDTVLLLHCSGSSHKIFEELIEKFDGRYRILAPDMLGYGATESWPQNEPYHFQYDIDIILQMLRIAKTPVHCIAYSFGGFLALEACLQAQHKFASLLLAEPSALHLLKHHEDETHWTQTQNMVHRCKELVVVHRDLKRASAMYFKYWATPLMWLLAPRNLKNQIQNKLHKMVKEFLSQEVEAATLEEYANIQTPTLLIGGDKSRSQSKIVVELLSQTLAKAQCEWLDDKNHVTLFADTDAIYPQIQTWLDKQRLVESCAKVGAQILTPDFA